MRKATKIVITFAVVLIAGLNLIVPAFAQDPFTSIAIGGFTGLSGAGLFSSMAASSGINIGWGSGGSDPVDAMWNVLNPDHVYFSGEKHEATNVGEDIYDYIEVDIGDWLEAQQNFISEFCENYQVTDNSSGNVSVSTSFGGIEFTDNVSDWLGVLPSSGDYSFDFGPFHFDGGTYVYIYFNGTKVTNGGYVGNYRGRNFRFTFSNGYFYLNFQNGGSYVASTSGQTLNPAENILWSSGTVNESVFDGWESAKVKIPNSLSGLQTGWTLSEFVDSLNRIWSGAGEDNIIIEDGGYVPPVPPTPLPTTPLGEVPFDDWVDLWGQGIYEQLENQSDALDFIGSNGTDAIEELESIDENIGALEETAESIDTNIGVGNGILGGIRSLAQSAVNYLEGIAEHVGELVEEIVEGTETLIAGILNQIPQVFSIIFGPIKQASSIWHYVVEWITSIGAPFQFIWSMASGTSYYIILPVYASLAASVVLAFYKRFGK